MAQVRVRLRGQEMTCFGFLKAWQQNAAKSGLYRLGHEFNLAEFMPEFRFDSAEFLPKSGFLESRPTIRSAMKNGRYLSLIIQILYFLCSKILNNLHVISYQSDAPRCSSVFFLKIDFSNAIFFPIIPDTIPNSYMLIMPQSSKSDQSTQSWKSPGYFVFSQIYTTAFFFNLVFSNNFFVQIISSPNPNSQMVTTPQSSQSDQLTRTWKSPWLFRLIMYLINIRDCGKLVYHASAKA